MPRDSTASVAPKGAIVTAVSIARIRDTDLSVRVGNGKWLVRTIDAAMLASFVDRTWRTWSSESLRPLEAAVKARRAELETH